MHVFSAPLGYLTRPYIVYRSRDDASSAATGRVAAGTGSAEMCEYCGCRGVAPIAELMDEHIALVERASHVRHDLATGDRAAAVAGLGVLVADLERHVAPRGGRGLPGAAGPR